MLIQLERMTAGGAKDCARLVQHAPHSQIVHRCRAGVGGADLEQEIRPEPALVVQGLLDNRALFSHVEKRPDKIAVVGKDLAWRSKMLMTALP